MIIVPVVIRIYIYIEKKQIIKYPKQINGAESCLQHILKY